MEIRLYDVVKIGDKTFDRIVAIYFLKNDTSFKSEYVEALRKYQVVVIIDGNIMQTWCDKVVKSE